MIVHWQEDEYGEERQPLNGNAPQALGTTTDSLPFDEDEIRY